MPVFFVWFLFSLNKKLSAEMMGNSELAPEVDVNSLDALISQNVVDQLLSKYMSTLTVSNNNARTSSDEFMGALVPQCSLFSRGNQCDECELDIVTSIHFHLFWVALFIKLYSSDFIDVNHDVSRNTLCFTD